MDTKDFWSDTNAKLKQWRRDHPGYAPQIYKVQKSIEKMHIEYINLLRQSHTKHKEHLKDKAEEILKQASELIKKLEKYELIATLSK